MHIGSIVDFALEHIERAIITGQLEPGQQIKEEEIASVLGVSRPPIREAFKILETTGLVVRKPRRGVFVVEITEWDAWEIYTLKAELYALATQQAFPHVTSEHLDRMGVMIESMKACIAKEPADILRYQDLNTGFHGVLVELTGHQRLRNLIGILHKQVQWFSYRSLSDPERLKRSCDNHCRIYSALLAGDEQETIRLTREHVLLGFENSKLERPVKPETTTSDKDAASAAANGMGLLGV
jgi:DNA-binding GntR family transcriptional regulator